MTYQDFPYISTIQDVLSHIEGREEFAISRKNGYTAIDYQIIAKDTFNSGDNKTNAIRRECRGIIFDDDGKIIRRPFHKFFNLNENTETLQSTLDFSKRYVVEEKLDGSMIVPFIVDGNLLWGTKLGVTEVSVLCNDFIRHNPNYSDFAESCIKNLGLSPIFEFTSPRQQIVLPYENDQLTFIAARHLYTGQYVPVTHMAKTYDIRTVTVKPVDTSTGIDEIVSFVKSDRDVEGIVINWPDTGKRVKLKSDWYCRIHSAKDSIRFENRLVEVIVSGNSDDLVANLDSQSEFVKEYEYAFWYNVKTCLNDIITYLNGLHKLDISQKVVSIKRHLPKEKHSTAFYFMNRPDADKIEYAKELIQKYTSSRSRLEVIRWLIGNGGAYKNRLLGE